MANDDVKQTPKQAEPYYVDETGAQRDRALWDDVLGDDRRPWDWTLADLVRARQRKGVPLTERNDKRRT